MKRIVLILALLIAAGCTPEPAYQAIYLVQGNGQLSQDDLNAHPEVRTTDSFKEFKRLARSKVALWIDINSVGLVDIGWLSEKPQNYYPVVLIGNSDEQCVFFHTMQYFLYEVPCCRDCSSPPPGFSVNQLTSESGGSMHGYEQTPTVQDILDITNPLLATLISK